MTEEYLIPGLSGRPIPVSMHYPSTVGEKNVIIFLHGFKGFKDWGQWPMLADELASEDFVVVRVSFSHNGTTPNSPTDLVDLKAFGDNTFTKEIEDVNNVIAWLNNASFSNGVTKGKTFVVGHSRGGAITILSAINHPEISKIATLAGVGTLNRFSTEEIKRWKEAGVAYTINSRTNQKLPMKFSLAQDYLDNEDNYNLEKISAQLQQPYLIVHAENDETVVLKEAQNLHKWTTNSRLEVIKGANHSFDGFHPYDENHLPKATIEAKNVIVDFFKG